MCSGIVRPKMRSAAWRISLWGTLAFALGTMFVFMFLQRFVERDIKRRSDAWLSGEVGVLSDVAKRTPKGALNARVVREIAELASREIPDKLRSNNGPNESVFFLQTAADGSLALWAGVGDGKPHFDALRGVKIVSNVPFDLHVRGFGAPFRVAAVRMEDGSQIYLGLSERDELRVLRNLRIRFLFLWLLNVLLGFAIVFYSARRMLGDVREITQAASRIGKSDLRDRLPASGRNDEVSQLASTLNHMLDRIEKSVQQLHTITDSLAHDLRSPLTAIRAKLEISLASGSSSQEMESIVSAIDELDRLTEILTTSLDVAEARADALRLNPTTIDLDQLLRVMIDLYEPCMSERGLRIQLRSTGPVEVAADAALLHRMIANLFDNELKHVSASSAVTISLGVAETFALLVIQDDGPGFAPDINPNMFKSRAKGQQSEGHGLGLAFVEAVVRAHGGSVTAANRQGGGAEVTIELPLAVARPIANSLPAVIAAE